MTTAHLPRVGYVLKKFPRLSETFIGDEVLALEEQGFAVSIFSLHDADDAQSQDIVAPLRAVVTYASSFRVEGDRMWTTNPDVQRFLDLVPRDRRDRLLKRAMQVAGWARARGIEHLHAHFMTVAAWSTYLAHLWTGIPFTVTAHAKDVYRTTVDPALYRTIGRRARALVTVCDHNLRYIERRLVPPDVNVVRVYNGVFPERVLPPPGPRNPRSIVGVGRLIEKKGWDVLLAACARLATDNVDFECTIIGDGDQRAALEATRLRLGLQDRVRFIGPLPRAAALGAMSAARIVAAPCVRGSDGNQDALPTVLLEALACGTPVVTTPVTGIPEIVDHGVHGLIVPERDPRALASALHSLLDDDLQWSQLSTSGRGRILERFDRRKTAQELVGHFGVRSTIELAGAAG